MKCKICADFPGRLNIDILNRESLPKYVEDFEDLGYFGDDLFSVRLRKCRKCKTYYREASTDNFETGGAVGINVERIDNETAIDIIKKIIEKVQSAEWLKSRYDLGKLKRELKTLEK